MTSSTSASSTPTMIVAFDCLRNPPELWRRVARNSLSSRALTRAPASSLWTMATTSFTRGVSMPRATAVNVRSATLGRPDRAVYDARPDDPASHACRSPTVSTDGSTSDPRASLVRRHRGGRDRRRPRDGPGPASSRGDRRPRRRPWRASSSRTRIGPGSERGRVRGLDDDADGAARGRRRRPGPPVRRGRHRPDATFDREATTADGTAFVGAYLPLVVSTRRRRGRPRVARLRLAGAARLDEAERATL